MKPCYKAGSSLAGVLVPLHLIFTFIKTCSPLTLNFSQTTNLLHDSRLSLSRLEPLFHHTLSSALDLLAPLFFHHTYLAKPQPWISPTLHLPTYVPVVECLHYK